MFRIGETLPGSPENARLRRCASRAVVEVPNARAFVKTPGGILVRCEGAPHWRVSLDGSQAVQIRDRHFPADDALGFASDGLAAARGARAETAVDVWPVDGLVAAFSPFSAPDASEGQDEGEPGFVVGVSRVGMVVLGESRAPARCSVGQFRKLEVEGAI